jgi:hypothetical protein
MLVVDCDIRTAYRFLHRKLVIWSSIPVRQNLPFPMMNLVLFLEQSGVLPKSRDYDGGKSN